MKVTVVSMNRPMGRLYLISTMQERQPLFPPSQGCVWVRQGGLWQEIDRETLHKLLYPDAWLDRFSTRTRLFDQMDRIMQENKKRMELLGWSDKDIEDIKYDRATGDKSW